MSFTASRVYRLIDGKDYNPSTNGNTIIKFRATATAGSPTLSGINSPVFNRIVAIVAAAGTGGLDPGVPVVTGPGVSGNNTSYDQVDLVISPPDPLLGTIDLTNPINATGTFEFVLYDSTIPSNVDAPVMAIHVLVGGDLQFNTIQGDPLIFTSASLLAGGIYYYAVALVTNLAGGGEYYGLAPNLKPLYIS
jgi:hypothetical protein